jgi:hypothetical protein
MASTKRFVSFGISYLPNGFRDTTILTHSKSIVIKNCRHIVGSRERMGGILREKEALHQRGGHEVLSF